MFDEQVIGQLRSIRDIWRWGTTALSGANLCYGHGTDNPQDEMDHLVCHVLRLPPGIPQEFFDAALLVDEKERIYRLVMERIKTRKPLPYLLGECWFAGIRLLVDERALIPRSPIAEMIEARFAPWLAADAVHRILDLCTGNGCLAIACALAFPEAQVDAVDISAAALELARLNVAEHGLRDRVCLIESDLFDALSGRQYDLIVSNPPYVPLDEVSALPQEFQQEPAQALRAGDDGLLYMGRILREAGPYLSEHGVLVGEVGRQWPLLEQAFPQHPFTWVEFERGGEGVFVLNRVDLGGES